MRKNGALQDRPLKRMPPTFRLTMWPSGNQSRNHEQNGLTTDLYRLYSIAMKTNSRKVGGKPVLTVVGKPVLAQTRLSNLTIKGAEEARKLFPSIVSAAERGETTVITRHGQAVAAMVPVTALPGEKVASLSTLAGSGKGMWGRSSARNIAKLRDEWNR